jgi:hypothetical protein
VRAWGIQAPKPKKLSEQGHLFLADGARAAVRTRKPRAPVAARQAQQSRAGAEFYGAASTIIVPDNLKVGATHADRYEPELQRSFEEMTDHYRRGVILARPHRPKHKSRVELICHWCAAGSWRGCGISAS